MTDWTETILENIAKVQTGPFGSQLKNEQYITGGTPVVTVEHINDFRIKDFDYPSVTNEDRDRLSKYLLKEGDIVFTRVGSVDLSAYVSKYQDGWMFSSRMLSVRPIKEVDSKYLSYFFRQPSFRSYIFRISVGATMPSINTSILKSIPISYPPLPEQKAIANVLTSFDDKIELLHQQNTTLETIAQTMFKEWFGKYQIGDELPKGWRFGKLGDIAINYSKTFKFSDKKVIFINTGDVLDGEFLHSNEISPIGLPGQAKKVIELYDILYSEIRPKNKRFAFVDFDTSYYVVSTKFMIIRPKYNFSPFILYLILKNQDTINEFNIIAESRSGTFPQITFDSVKDFPLVIPNIDAQKEFESILKPIMEKQRVNKEQIQSLTKTRDTLLPKLMSGQVRVKM